jgi:bifunctional enzyme CysN/CysC
MSQELLRISTAGSVDDGKSTLIGRLLYDSGGVYEDQLQAVRRVSRNGLDLALLTDGLRSEREQGITIDVAYRYVSTPRRKFIIADTPGHEQYTRNMATGASTASVALILIDARKGVLPQTVRHASIAWLLGIRQVVVVINKMDLVGFSEQAFSTIREAFQRVQSTLPDAQVYFVPVVATEGDNVTQISERMGWFKGPSVLEYLEMLPSEEKIDAPFRMGIQYVIREDGHRGYAGQIASGVVTVGDTLLALPSRKKVRVASIPYYNKQLSEAFAPSSVSLCLADHVDLGRGDILADADHPPEEARAFRARIVWMSEKALALNRPYLFKHLSQMVYGEIEEVHSRLDVTTLTEIPAHALQFNDIAMVKARTYRPLFCDRYAQNRKTGSFIVIDPDTNQTVGAGMIDAILHHPAAPRAADGNGLTVWFTGLSSAGKSTLSREVYEQLVSKGHRVELLDGDEVRKHLSHGLGFSKEDRNENVRRIGFVAELLTRHGVITLVSAISPYRDVREEMRERIANFLEVYVNAPLSVCEGRDIKGLYRRARSGSLPRFTGIDDPYEEPLSPEVECRTDLEAIADSVSKIVDAIESRLASGKVANGNSVQTAERVIDVSL